MAGGRWQMAGGERTLCADLLGRSMARISLARSRQRYVRGCQKPSNRQLSNLKIDLVLISPPSPSPSASSPQGLTHRRHRADPSPEGGLG